MILVKIVFCRLRETLTIQSAGNCHSLQHAMCQCPEERKKQNKRWLVRHLLLQRMWQGRQQGWGCYPVVSAGLTKAAVCITLIKDGVFTTELVPQWAVAMRLGLQGAPPHPLFILHFFSGLEHYRGLWCIPCCFTAGVCADVAVMIPDVYCSADVVTMSIRWCLLSGQEQRPLNQISGLDKQVKPKYKLVVGVNPWNPLFPS